MINNKPVIIVAAMDQKMGIGFNNALPWPKIPADFKRFRQLTIDNPVVLGRKTYESYGSKPLPRRQHFIVSRHPTYDPPDAVRAGSVESAIRMAAASAIERVAIIGGFGIFQEALERDFVDFMYLTHIEKEFPADVFFPQFPVDDWLVIAEDRFTADDQNPFEYRFVTYAKKERVNEQRC